MNLIAPEAEGGRRIILGVAGGSGSGKTTIVRAITGRFQKNTVAVIHHDQYYKDRSRLDPADREHINYDHPDALETTLLIRHLRHLRAGRSVQIPVYDFATHTRTSESKTVYPTPVVIVDGILVLSDESLRRELDIKVFVATEPDLCLMRRLSRDIAERGRTLESVLEQYRTTVRPMHVRFVEPSRRHADIVVPEGGNSEVAVDLLATKIAAVLDRARD